MTACSAAAVVVGVSTAAVVAAGSDADSVTTVSSLEQAAVSTATASTAASVPVRFENLRAMRAPFQSPSQITASISTRNPGSGVWMVVRAGRGSRKASR